MKGKNEEITGKLDPKYWVQKSDPLVLMRSVPFSLGELKILDTYISRINAADSTQRTVIFTKDEYEELMGLTCADYRTLKKNTKGLLEKSVELEMPDEEYMQFTLFTKNHYHKDEYGKPVIELSCSEYARDLFFCIGKYHYFKYALENIVKLTRKASYLLYVYVRRNLFQGEWEITLAELRDTVLDCKGQESYQEFKEFKRAVLDPAAKEINKKTDCRFTYEAVKRGRRVIKIKFTCIGQELMDGQLSFDELPTVPLIEQHKDEDFDDEPEYSNDNLALLAGACNYEFDNAQMENIFAIIATKKFPESENGIWIARFHYLREKYTRMNVYYAKKKKDGKRISNRYAYFTSMLEKDAQK